MIRAGVDESGTHSADALMSVAFCMTTSTQWKHFEAEWLPERQLPAGVKHYHAKDARCAELTEKLIRHMTRRIERICVVTLVESEYRKDASARVLSFLGGGYAMAFQFGMYQIHKWLWDHGQRISYVIESGHSGEGAVEKFLSHFAKSSRLRYRSRYVSHQWVPKGTPTIDPADLVSHEVSSNGGDMPPLLRPLANRIEIHHAKMEAFQETTNAIEQGFKAHREERWARKRRRG